MIAVNQQPKSARYLEAYRTLFLNGFARHGCIIQINTFQMAKLSSGSYMMSLLGENHHVSLYQYYGNYNPRTPSSLALSLLSLFPDRLISGCIDSLERCIMSEIACTAAKAIALFPPFAVDLCRREVPA